MRLRVQSDDGPLLDELRSTLGAPLSQEGPESLPLLSATVQTRTSGAFARVSLNAPDDDLLSPADFLLGLASSEFPFRLLPSRSPWTEVALAGEDEPFFALNGRDCRVRLTPGWRKAVALLLLQRVMRTHRDAIFFHAASVVIGGQGLLLVGRKGAGKSTLALALASHGHGLLGDEHACYRPATREILPFRRPVGIKPGPRASAVDQALRRLGRNPERDGMMRLDVECLFPGTPAESAPLRAVVFLEGFGSVPILQPLEPGRGELARLQPVGSSLVNAPRTERVFQMTQMLAGARVFHLTVADPDATAQRLDESITPWA